MSIMGELLELLETQLVGEFGFIDDILTEELGNLATLKAGPLLDVFKQRGYELRHGGYSEDEPGKKFNSGQLGRDSEIITIDKLKNPNQIKKACLDQDALGAVFYVDDKAFMAMNGRYFKAADVLVVKTNFSKIDNILNRADIKKQDKDQWDSTERKYKTITKKGGQAMRASEFAQLTTEIINQLKTLEKDVKVKLIIADKELLKKRIARNNNPAPEVMSKESMFQHAKEELKIRLAKFKNEKLNKIETKEELIAMLKKSSILKAFSFKGHNYVSTSAGYEDSFFKLMHGKTATIHYNADTKEKDFHTLYISYKLNGLTIEVVEVR